MQHAPQSQAIEDLQMHLMVSMKYRAMMAQGMETGSDKTHYLLTADLMITETQHQLETLQQMNTNGVVKPEQPGHLNCLEAERILESAFGPGAEVVPPANPVPVDDSTDWVVLLGVATVVLLLVSGIAYLVTQCYTV